MHDQCSDTNIKEPLTVASGTNMLTVPGTPGWSWCVTGMGIASVPRVSGVICLSRSLKLQGQELKHVWSHAWAVYLRKWPTGAVWDAQRRPGSLQP